MPFIDIPDGSFHYATHNASSDSGDARNVVFVHGGFGSSSGLWRGTMAALPDGVSGYAVDLFVRSETPKRGYTVQASAERVADLIRALKLPPVTLLGHSMGGVVSQLVALRHPELVAQLGLVCTGPNIRNHGVATQVYEKLKTEGANPKTMAEISRHWFHAALPDPAVFDAYLADAADAPLDGMLEAQASLMATDVEPELPNIKAPTLVFHGVLDHGRTIDHAERLCAGIPDSGMVLFKKSGHAPFWEEQAAFDAALHTLIALGRRA